MQVILDKPNTTVREIVDLTVSNKGNLKYTRANPPLIEPHIQQLLLELDNKVVRTVRFINDSGYYKDDSLLVLLDNEKRSVQMPMPTKKNPNKIRMTNLVISISNSQ